MSTSNQQVFMRVFSLFLAILVASISASHAQEFSETSLERENNVWHFDDGPGRKVMRTRAISRNETHAVEMMISYANTQREYGAMSVKKTGVPVYAQRFLSKPAQKDGLYWPSEPYEREVATGFFVAQAETENDPLERHREGYHGYYYRILTRQGKAAPGGARNYIVHGKMTGGFAAVAWPTNYKETGLMTFIMSGDDQVYRKDLGPDTTKIAAGMVEFNPGPGWEPVGGVTAP
jgi:hypothetical protein